MSHDSFSFPNIIRLSVVGCMCLVVCCLLFIISRLTQCLSAICLSVVSCLLLVARCVLLLLVVCCCFPCSLDTRGSCTKNPQTKDL